MILTDGGIETRIVYEFHRTIPNFSAYTLLGDAEGRRILQSIYGSYAQVAAAFNLRIQLGAPTWRASRVWGADVAAVNAQAVQFMRELIAQSGTDAILAGVVGPHSDGYAGQGGLTADAARAYHAEQAQALAQSGVDMLYAPTFPAFEELLGAAEALAQTGVPYALAPMLAPDGRMMDGTPLGEAIARIDDGVSRAPQHYMIGCLYPTHAASALEATRAAYPAHVQRVRGLKANASPLLAEELDKLGHVDAEPVKTFARDEISCAREFGLDILGGCCGTDQRYIAAVAADYTGGA